MDIEMIIMITAEVDAVRANIQLFLFLQPIFIF